MPEARATVIVEVRNEGAKALTDLGGQMQAANTNLNKLSLGAAGATKSTGGLAQGIGQLTQRFAGVNIATLGVVGGVAAVGTALVKATSATMVYGLQVADTSKKLGISAKAASYMIQMADDLRIETATMEVGFRNLIDKGTQPTIENLMALAAQYQALTDPVEKAQFSMEKFGMRAGMEMQKLLSATPAQIMAMAKSAELAGTIMGEEGAAGAVKFATAIDNAKDTWNGLVYAIGQGVIQFTNSLIPTEQKMAGLTYERSEKMREYARTHGYAAEAVRNLGKLEDNLVITLGSVEAKFGLAQNALETWQGVLDRSQDGMKRWGQVGQDAASIMDRYFYTGSKGWIAAATEIDEHTGSNIVKTYEYEKALKTLDYQLMKGKITPEEYGDALDELGESIGLDPFAKYKGSASDATQNVINLQSAINAIPDVTTKYINIVTRYSGGLPLTTPIRGRDEDVIKTGCALGGTWGGGVSEVGEQGAEGIVPRPGGGYNIIPHARWEQMKKGRGVKGFALGGAVEDVEVYGTYPGLDYNPDDPNNTGYAPTYPGAPGGGPGGEPPPPSVEETAAAVTSAIPEAVGPMLTRQMQDAARVGTETNALLKTLIAETRKQATNDGVGSAVSNALQQGNMMG